jgi:hypothetical protein
MKKLKNENTYTYSGYTTLFLEVPSIPEIFHFLPFPAGSISGFIHGNGTEISGYELWEI